jgi:hypothetical protein
MLYSKGKDQEFKIHTIKKCSLIKKHLCQYSVRRLIGSRIIESAAYCNQIIGIPLAHKKCRFFNHSVIVITFILAQSNPIKRRTLY